MSAVAAVDESDNNAGVTTLGGEQPLDRTHGIKMYVVCKPICHL
jgi:hypothetical protein